MKGSKSRTQLAMMAVLGLGGWLAVLWFILVPGPGLVPLELSTEFAACILFSVSARLLAFRAIRRVRIALDSAFYIVTVFICGVVPAAALVLIALSFDFLIRFVGGSGLYRFGEASWRRVMVHGLYNGGLPALLLLSIGALFGDEWLRNLDDVALSWFLPAYAFVFLVIHYLLTGGIHWLIGTKMEAVGWFILRVVGAEFIMVPFSLAMVLGYKHQGLYFFLLLGASSVLMNAVYRRQAMARDELDKRVDELSTLNEVGRVISGSLQTDALITNIATATLHLVGHTSRFMLGLVDEKSGNLNCRFFDEAGNEFLQVEIGLNSGLSGWVMANRSPLLLSELQREYGHYVKDETYNDPNFHSWLGVPLLVYDEVVGVMSVQSEDFGVYTNDHLRVLMTIADQAAVAIENARLYELATVDGLTGLFVRRYFDHRLGEEWERSTRYSNPFVVAIFDLDNFKKINDTYGHQIGDKVLRATGAIIRKNMRSIDIAARYGGEEFCFLLPRTELSEAMAVAERIRQDISKEEVSIDSGALWVTVSIGLAGFPDTESTSAIGLLSEADQALYQAKRAGKNRVVVYQK